MNDRLENAGKEIVSLVRLIADTLALAVLVLVPWLIRGVCVVVAITACWYAAPRVWQGYGGDAPALLVAGLVVLVPLAVVYLSGTGYGGLLVAGGVVGLVGWLVLYADAVVRSLAPVGILALVILYAQRLKKTEDQK